MSALPTRPSGTPFDVAVVGGGVVGAAVARLLARHQLEVVLIEAMDDVGAGTSKANTAILHTGFDATPGSLEARVVARGYHLLSDYAKSAGISVDPVGAMLVAWTDEQAATLAALQAKARANGYLRAEIVDHRQVYEHEPHLGQGVVAGLSVPDEHIIDPWSTPLAFVDDAVANGCHLRLGHRVVEAQVGGEATALVCETTAGAPATVSARFVVNAAGLHGDTLHRAVGFDGFTIKPRRGELIVFDKWARRLLRGTVLPVPTATTKGVLAAPTVFGNVMVGPTADDIDDRRATASTRDGIDRLVAAAHRILPPLANEEVTAIYAGLRAATEHSDYCVTADSGARYVCLGGIRSTGLTASMALAEHAVALLEDAGLVVAPKDRPVSIRRTPLGESAPRPYQAPDASPIVCHCERVTAAEIRDAVGGAVPATTIDGLRRRTRALSGRCQGFYCFAEVCSLTGWSAEG